MEKFQNLKIKRSTIFFLTSIGQKRKRQMTEPIETAIIHAKQSFEIAGSLNLVQIEREDDRALNVLKKYKNVSYTLIPIGILFPASVKNNTEQIFITCRKLNNIKKSLINSKIYNLIGIIDLKKLMIEMK